MSELLRQSVLEKNVCVASYVLWTEETKARVQVLYYQHHLWIIWWSQPLDFIWKSASTGTSRVLMQISLQPSSGFNMLQPISGTSHEIFIPGRDEKNMKKTGISLKTCHCSFQWRTALKKESKVGPQPWISTSGVGTSFSKVLGQKKPGYGMGNNYIKLEQCLILYWVCSPTW